VWVSKGFEAVPCTWTSSGHRDVELVAGQVQPTSREDGRLSKNATLGETFEHIRHLEQLLFHESSHFSTVTDRP
jgi:hypothetical protein